MEALARSKLMVSWTRVVVVMLGRNYSILGIP